MNAARHTLRGSWSKVVHERIGLISYIGTDGTHGFRVEPNGANVWHVYVDGQALRSLSGRFKRFTDEKKAFAVAERHAEKLSIEQRQAKLF